MSPETHTLDISLLGKEFRVACPPEERESLLVAVRFLESRMREVGTRTRSNGERLAVMVALNLAHELLGAQRMAGVDGEAIRRRISAMEARLDEALAQAERAS